MIRSVGWEYSGELDTRELLFTVSLANWELLLRKAVFGFCDKQQTSSSKDVLAKPVSLPCSESSPRSMCGLQSSGSNA